MTSTAFDDQYTTAPEPVRQPYDTVAILRRNVADLELALRTQTELKEKAEAELARLREQAPAGWVDADGDFYHGRNYPNVFPTAVPVYAAPIPAPAPAVPELDPMTRLIVSDPKQLKPKKQEPAVPTNTIPEGDDFNGTTPHMIRCIESLVAMNDRGALAPHGLCGHSRTLLLASANRLRQQQAHVVPAVPGEWRETLSKLVGIVESSAKFHGCNGVTKQARALLQSAEVQAGDKWQLTPAPTHPADRNAGEVRHD